MPGAIEGALGRPLWQELRAPAERRALVASTLFTDADGLDGQGRPVVLVTGYMATASSTTRLADWLTRGGYAVTVADMERNRRSSSWAAERIDSVVRAAADDAGARVTVIGHSRGGQQCRVVTARDPDSISQLITLGSPVRQHLPRQIVLRASIEGLRIAARLGIGPDADLEADRGYAAELASRYEVNVPWTAIWSKVDGIVEWQACFGAGAANVEVRASHAGLTASIASYAAIAEALAKPTGMDSR